MEHKYKKIKITEHSRYITRIVQIVWCRFSFFIALKPTYEVKVLTWSQGIFLGEEMTFAKMTFANFNANFDVHGVQSFLAFCWTQPCWLGVPLFLAHLFIYLFRTCSENFRPRSLKVRSPGHVKWPHLRKRFNARHSYTEWLFIKLLWLISLTVSIKCILGILISVTQCQVNFATAPSEISQWEKMKRRLFLDKTLLKHSQTSGCSSNWHPESEYCDQLLLLMLPRSF